VKIKVEEGNKYYFGEWDFVGGNTLYRRNSPKVFADVRKEITLKGGIVKRKPLWNHITLPTYRR